MDYKKIFYPESRFGGFTDIDGTVVFYTRVQSLLQPSWVILDIGCGRGAYGEDTVTVRRNLRILKGKVRKVVGLDVDAAAAENPFLDEFRRLDGERWPIDDDAIDLAVCDSVLEHVANPDAFFAELRRVLRRGGYLCLRTTNAWGYVALASRLVPNRSHARVLSRVQENRKAEDVFPTLYRCNSAGKLRRALGGLGFDHEVYGYESEPRYLSFSRVAYRLGRLYQRLAPRPFRAALFAFARLEDKPQRDAGHDDAGTGSRSS